MTHFGNESLKISVVWFLSLFWDIKNVYCYLCLYLLFCFWNPALFIQNAHVSHFCSDQKTWTHDKFKVERLFIITDPRRYSKPSQISF